MDNDPFSKIMKIFLAISIIVVVVILVDLTGQQEGAEENIYKINVSEAVFIVSNDPIAQFYSFVNFSVDQDGSEVIIYKINASEAVIIVSNDSIARNYMFVNFEKPEWRAVNVSMLVNSTDFNGSEYLWDVKIMERTCACNSVKDLYVIEGQVSPITGEIINITTGLVLESNYDKQMCASTVCH